jgi:hypothetical protein
MRVHRASLVALLLTVAVSFAVAQEVQVPIDSAGRLDRIDRELEQKLGLFPEFKEFQEARLYLSVPPDGSKDSSFILEITHLVDSRPQRVRRPLSAAEAEELRRKVTARISERSPQITLDQEGRSRLITGTTILGLTYYGLAIPAAFDVQDTKTTVALYMLSGASGFIIPYLSTSHSQVTRAQANISLYGATAGLLHGVLLYGLFANDFDAPTMWGVSVLTGVTEAFVGYHLAGNNDLEEGKGGVITGLGTFGLGFGAATAYLLRADDARPYAGGMLLGTGAGFLVGNVMANMQHYSAGDAQVLLTTGVLGAYTPVGLLILAGSEDGKVYVSSAMLGSAAGLVLGHYLVRGHEFSDAQGNYIALGTVAGTALGLGTAYLLSSDGSDEKLYAGASLVGSVGGFIVMYSLLEDDAVVRDEGRNWRFQIAPAGIGALLLGRFPASDASVPLAGFQYSF